MKNNFGFPIILVALSVLAKQFKESGVDLVKMKTAEGYLQLLRGLRYLLIGVFGLIFLALFLIAGLIMAEVALVSLAASNPQAQMMTLCAIGVVNAAVALAILLHAFSSRRWLEMAAKSNKTVRKMLRTGQL